MIACVGGSHVYLKRVCCKRQGLSVIPVLCKDEHCAKLLCSFPHEARVVGKHQDVPLIPCVEEDDTVVPAPVVSGHDDPLLERSVARDGKVVDLMRTREL